MSNQNQNDLHRFKLEVSGSERKLVKLLLTSVKLTDAVKRIRIEIDSTEPIADDFSLSSVLESDDEPEQVEAESEPESDVSKVDDSSTSDSNTHKFECLDCGKKTEDLASLSGHLNNKYTDCGWHDDEEQEPESAEELTQQLLEDEEEVEGRPPLELLDEYEADEVAYEFLNRFGPEEREELSTADLRSLSGMPLSADTQKFYVAGMIKVVPGQIRAGDLADLFDDPEYMWQMSYSSVSSNLSLLKQGGVLAYNPEQRTYDLTALGERYVDAVIEESPGYAIRGARDVPKPDRREKSYTVS